MILEQIEKDVFLGNPFIYKLHPESYPRIVNAVYKNPHFFDEINRLKNNIFGNEGISIEPAILQDYYSIMQRSYNNSYDKEEILRDIKSVEEYRIFFKEMGASLKFNPLSRSKSAIHIRERANILINKYGALIKPKAVARFINVEIHDGSLIVEGMGIEFKSKKLSSFFGGNDDTSFTGNKTTLKAQMIIYVVTIGSGIDDTVKLLGMEGEMFDSYVLNAIGAASAEMIAEDLNYYFNDTISDGKTELQYYRFSPGYGDWLVNDQKNIFSLLKPEERIGVILNDGYIMLPEKSTSGIMGLKSNTQKPILHSGNE